MVIQLKWTREARNFKIGDVVLVADSNALRSQYSIARIKDVYPDKQKVIRKVLLCYKNHKVNGDLRTHTAGTEVEVTQSVQKLALLVPIETQ